MDDKPKTKNNPPDPPAAANGGVWKFFRKSPLVGVDIDLRRDEDPGREIDLE